MKQVWIMLLSQVVLYNIARVNCAIKEITCVLWFFDLDL